MWFYCCISALSPCPPAEVRVGPRSCLFVVISRWSLRAFWFILLIFISILLYSSRRRFWDPMLPREETDKWEIAPREWAARKPEKQKKPRGEPLILHGSCVTGLFPWWCRLSLSEWSLLDTRSLPVFVMFFSRSSAPSSRLLPLCSSSLVFWTFCLLAISFFCVFHIYFFRTMFFAPYRFLSSRNYILYFTTLLLHLLFRSQQNSAARPLPCRPHRYGDK